VTTAISLVVSLLGIGIAVAFVVKAGGFQWWF
jgi:hypothetical protein